MLNIQKNYLIFIEIYHFYQKERKLKNARSFSVLYKTKTNYVVHINALKQALNHGLILEKVHRVIQFNQGAWLKPYIDMNTKLTNEAKNALKKISLS